MRDIAVQAKSYCLGKTDELETLLAATYALWEPGWVNFNWRAYTYDHVQRVRALALTLGEREAADLEVLNLAGLLHDVTKAYDGEYVLDSHGRRAVDARGYWLTETRPPSGTNEVTEIYDWLGLAGRPHNESGAAVARELLSRRGAPEGLIYAVSKVIEDHLCPANGASIESCCLYDADTIDANIGLPAFVRNIYINLHNRDLHLGPDSLPTEIMLDRNPIDYLGPYLTERLPEWAAGKRRDFIPRLQTPSGVSLAEARLERLQVTCEQLRREIEAFEDMARHGCLAVVLHFMRHREDPSINAEVSYLRETWLTKGEATPEAAQLVNWLDREVRGLE